MNIRYRVTLTQCERDELGALLSGGNHPARRLKRAQILLAADAGVGTNAIMRETGKSKTCVWRWQERFAVEGVDGSCETSAALAHPEARSLGRRAGRGSDYGGTAARSDALDQCGDGRAGRSQQQFRAADLAGTRAPAASGPAVQAVQ